MKNITKSLIISLTFLISPILPLYGLELGVGMIADYSWWRPPYEGKMMIPKYQNLLVVDNSGRRFDTTGAANYGPSFSIKLMNGLSFSTAFQYGAYHLTNSAWNIPDSFLAWRTITDDVQKFSPRAHIAYSFNGNLAIHAGFRARIFRYTSKLQQFDPWGGGFQADSKLSINNYIPEIGISFQLPIIDTFSIGISLTGLALWGTEEVTKAIATMQDGGTWGIMDFKWVYPEGTYFAYGFDSSLSFTYRIKPLNTELSLGAHYGLLRYVQKNKERSFNLYNENHEYSYTVFFSATYIFVL